MKESHDKIKEFYKKEDPWMYKTTEDDIRRKEYIVGILRSFGHFKRALDIGAGEGWITEGLPAAELWGYELSDHAASRFPLGVGRIQCPRGKYDLVVATGILYNHYDWERFVDMINDHASGIVLTCSMANAELPKAIEAIRGDELFRMEFPYRHCGQRLRVFNFSDHEYRMIK